MKSLYNQCLTRLIKTFSTSGEIQFFPINIHSDLIDEIFHILSEITCSDLTFWKEKVQNGEMSDSDWGILSFRCRMNYDDYKYKSKEQIKKQEGQGEINNQFVNLLVEKGDIFILPHRFYDCNFTCRS